MIKDIKVDIIRQRLYLDDNVTYGRAVTYGSGSTMTDLKMTMLRYKKGSGTYPAIVWLCGGGWVTQDFNAHVPELIAYAQAGYLVASVQYRLAGECRFPAQLNDIKAAIRYLRAHAKQLDIDPERIGVMGESAGGHLASLIGSTGETREFDEGDYLDQSSAVQAACCLYPPVNFQSMFEVLNARKKVENSPLTGLDPLSVEAIFLRGGPFNNPEMVKRTSPLTYLTENAPPYFIMHGTQDGTVPIAQGELLHNALEAKGVPVTMYRIQGAQHADIHFYQPKIKSLVIDFFDSVLKK